jgi:hypothetical protein
MWSKAEDRRGFAFETDKRLIQLYETNGGAYAVDLVHPNGCTRIYLGESYSEGLERMDAHMRNEME